MAITARRTAPNISSSPRSRIRVQEQDVSSGLLGIAQAFEQQGDENFRAAMERQREDDDIAVMDAFNQAQQGAEVRFNGEGGFTRTQGKEAFGVMDEANKYLNDSKNEVMKMLANDEQRAKFAALMDKSNAGRIAGLNKHIETQRTQYNQNVLNGTVTNEFNRMINAPGDEETYEDAMFNAELALREKFKGQGDEFISSKLDEFAKQVNGNVLLQLVERNTDEAKAFIEKHEEQLTPEAKIQANKKIEQKEKQAEAWHVSDGIIQQAEDEGDALAQASTIKDPEVREDVTTLVRNHFQDERRVYNERESERINDQMNSLDEYITAGDITSINALITSEEDYETRKAMESVVSSQLTGKGRTTNLDTYQELMDVANTDKQRLLIETNRNRHKLSPSDYKAFVDMYYDQDNEKVKYATSELSQMNEIARGNSMKFGAKESSENNIKYNNFKLEYENKKQAFVDKENRQPTYAERDEMMRGLLVEIELESGAWYMTNKDVALYQLTNEEVQNLTVDDLDYDSISDDDVDIITQSLQTKDLPVTEENIKSAYLRYLRSLR